VGLLCRAGHQNNRPGLEEKEREKERGEEGVGGWVGAPCCGRLKAGLPLHAGPEPLAGRTEERGSGAGGPSPLTAGPCAVMGAGGKGEGWLDRARKLNNL
jgi:hypothetical protein